MALFMIIALDTKDSAELRAQYFNAHLDVLADLYEQNRLFSVGPLESSLATDANKVGSIIVADFPSEAAVHQWYENEPFNKHGVYETIIIRPFVESTELIANHSASRKASAES